MLLLPLVLLGPPAGALQGLQHCCGHSCSAAPAPLCPAVHADRGREREGCSSHRAHTRSGHDVPSVLVSASSFPASLLNTAKTFLSTVFPPEMLLFYSLMKRHLMPATHLGRRKFSRDTHNRREALLSLQSLWFGSHHTHGPPAARGDPNSIKVLQHLLPRTLPCINCLLHFPAPALTCSSCSPHS